MGCNCSKNRSQTPTGLGRATTSQQETQRAGAARASSSFELQQPDGTKKTYGSSLEASAAKARAGGGQIRPI